MNEVMILKLISGEEVMGEVKAHDSGYLIVKNPANLIARNENGQVKVGMAPFSPFTEEDTIHIYPHAVMADYKPAGQLRNEYSRLFGSGIQIASVMP